MSRLVYIATRFADAEHAHTVVRPALIAAGLGVCSTWHAPPWAPEDLDALDPIDVVRIYQRNRLEVASADAVLVLAAEGARETLAEAESAYRDGTPVLWVGRPHLSAKARAATGYWTIVPSLEAAVHELARPFALAAGAAR